MAIRVIKRLGFFCLILSLTACAGPSSPFGALNGWVRPSATAEAKIEVTAADLAVDAPKVSFLPGRQVLHGPTAFTVLIEDPEGVPENFVLMLTYNGVDTASQFAAQAERQYLDPSHKRLRLTLNHLRLSPLREHRIRVVYRRALGARAIAADYLPPRCSAFETSRSVASLPEFQPPAEYIHMINWQATRHKLNPYYVAGLIAQESGFDPSALSRARALGLTQVTPQGEAEVAKRFLTWPRYPGLEDMPYNRLRSALASGEVNSTNEWRLNPLLSIEGGVEYLTYLADYWSRPDKSARIVTHLGGDDLAFSEVMLASYNAGAARVAAALDLYGESWLEAEDLAETRNYVRRVVSYCDYFASRED